LKQPLHTKTPTKHQNRGAKKPKRKNKGKLLGGKAKKGPTQYFLWGVEKKKSKEAFWTITFPDKKPRWGKQKRKEKKTGQNGARAVGVPLQGTTTLTTLSEEFCAKKEPQEQVGVKKRGTGKKTDDFDTNIKNLLGTPKKRVPRQ